VHFSALVVGSLTPDLVYYLKLTDLGPFTHSLGGTVLFSIPAGLVLLALLLLLRQPLWFLLPQPHRDALEPFTFAPFRYRAWPITVASLWLGAWTHIAWDSLTHSRGSMVNLLPALRQSLELAGVELPIYYLLQLLSTLLGTAALLLAYARWLHRQAPMPRIADSIGERRRYGWLCAMALLAGLIATPFALNASPDLNGFYALRVFAFNLAIDGANCFITLYSLVAVAVYAARDR
jgi:hypothetical protein